MTAFSRQVVMTGNLNIGRSHRLHLSFCKTHRVDLWLLPVRRCQTLAEEQRWLSLIMHLDSSIIKFIVTADALVERLDLELDSAWDNPTRDPRFLDGSAFN